MLVLQRGVVSEKKWEKPLIRINITCAPVVKITFHICVNLNQMKQIRFFPLLSIMMLYTNCNASLSSVTRRRSSSTHRFTFHKTWWILLITFLLFSNIWHVQPLILFLFITFSVELSLLFISFSWNITFIIIHLLPLLSCNIQSWYDMYMNTLVHPHFIY